MPFFSSKVMPNSLRRNVETGVDDAVELQVWLQLRLVEGEFFRAQLLLVEAPVPGGEFLVAAGFGRQPLQLLLVGGRLLQRLFPDRVEQIVHRLRRLGHGVVELQRGEGAIAEQLGLLGAQLQHVAHHRGVVAGAAILAAHGEGAEGGLPQVAAFGEGGERLIDRARQSDGVTAFLAARLGGLGHRAFDEVGQAGKVCLIEEQRPVALVGQHVLAESGAERGQFLADVGQPLLAVGVELGAGADKAFPGLFQHPQRLGVELQASRGAGRDRRCGQTVSRSSRSPRNASTSLAKSRAPAPGSCRWCGRRPGTRRSTKHGRAARRQAPALPACSRWSAHPCCRRWRRSRPHAP